MKDAISAWSRQQGPLLSAPNPLTTHRTINFSSLG